MKKKLIVFIFTLLIVVGCSKEMVAISYDLPDDFLGETEKAIGLEGKKGSRFDPDFFLTREDINDKYVERFVGWIDADTNEKIDEETTFEKDTIIKPKLYTQEELRKKQQEEKEKEAELRKKREEQRKKTERSEREKYEITDDDKSYMIVFTQLALKDYGFEDDTSPQKQNWDIDIVNRYSDPMEWKATTRTRNLGKVKLFIYWDKENETYTRKFFSVGQDIIIDNRTP